MQGKPRVSIGSEPLENVYTFCYLGTEFQADGDTTHALAVRMAMAKSQFGKFTDVWASRSLPLQAKLRLYEAAVVSVLSYGHESWSLDRAALSSLKGWIGLECSVPQ